MRESLKKHQALDANTCIQSACKIRKRYAENIEDAARPGVWRREHATKRGVGGIKRGQCKRVVVVGHETGTRLETRGSRWVKCVSDRNCSTATRYGNASYFMCAKWIQHLNLF